MYATFILKNKLMFITAETRKELNQKVDQINDTFNEFLPDEVEVDEERDFGDEVKSYQDLIKQNPEYSQYELTNDISDFCDLPF